MKQHTSDVSRGAKGDSKPVSRLCARSPDEIRKRRKFLGIIFCILALSILLIVLAVPLILKYTQDKKTDSSLHVSVSVALRQDLVILDQIPTIAIDENDLNLGYIDVPSATRISIYNNDKKGCLIHFNGLQPPFEKTLINGLGGEVQVGTRDSFVYQEYVRGTITRTLDYRFFLSDDAMPGEYDWPLTISLDETISQ